jgi:hypothetical protein
MAGPIKRKKDKKPLRRGSETLLPRFLGRWAHLIGKWAKIATRS